MAEAFAALSIAANIAQFVDYARKLISSGKEIYNSVDGARDEHQALRIIVEDIKNLSDEAKPADSNSQLLPDETALRKLAAECEPLAYTLLALLKDLEVPSDARFRGLHTVRQTIRSAAKKKDIQDLQRRLADIDVRLRERASRMLQKRNHSSLSSSLNLLTQANRRLKMNIDVTLERLRNDIMKTLKIQGELVAMGQQTGLEDLSKQLLILAEEGQKISQQQDILAQQQKILQTLIFEEMEQREESIKDAHKTTLDWVFKKNETQFMNWLKTEKGIYWVRGKAGSGKSTLMKYICNHKTTLDTLHHWAGSEELFTASFFFWSSGFPIQKSQVGLLQSLLYQVLRACPALILEVCPSKGAREPWKRKELFEVLDKVSKQRVLPAKFCFFVDGLDEYEGDDEDIIALLQDLASSPSIKICVSSRPWNCFLDAFDDSKWKLVLEQLTKGDMRQYVHTMLVQNKAFSMMANLDPRCGSLVLQIAEKAQGVWLWVYLVVRDLLRDLKGGEEFPLLQRRLDSFPDELEKYFANILDRVDKIHREETARIFLMTVTAVQPVPLLSLKYLSMEITDPDYAFKLEICPLPAQEAYMLKTKWKKLLNSRCRDLLEVDGEIQMDSHTILSTKIDFLHRTVRDFLRHNYQDELRNRAGPGFEARTSLCNVMIALSKALPNGWFVDEDGFNAHDETFTLVDEMTYYARDLELKDARSVSVLLDELDRVNCIRFKSFIPHWSNARNNEFRAKKPINSSLYQKSTFLSLAIEAGLRMYTKETLEANKARMTQRNGYPLLDYALRPIAPPLLFSQVGDHSLDPQMVLILLEHGSDPNEKIKECGGRTVFGLFLACCYDACGDFSYSDLPPEAQKNEWFQAIEHMIDHGADPTREVPLLSSLVIDGKTTKTTEGRGVMLVPVLNVLENIFGNDKAKRLRLQMEEVAKRKRRQSTSFRKWLGAWMS